MSSSPSSAARSDVLIDASTIVRSYDLVDGGAVSVASLFALSNLVDSLVLQGNLATMSPDEEVLSSFSEALSTLGIRPELLTISPQERERIIAVENRARNLDFGVVSFDADGDPFVPGSAVDLGAAVSSEDLLQQSLRQASATGAWSLDKRKALQQELGWEVKKYFRSVYNQFHVNQEEALLSAFEGRDEGTIPYHIICYLAFRSDLYLALGRRDGLPYSPDALRSFMIQASTRASAARLFSVARTVIRNHEAALLRRQEELLDLGPFPAIAVPVPSVLALLIGRAETPIQLMEEARFLGQSPNAIRIQKSLRDLQGLHPRVRDQRELLQRRLQELRTHSEALAAEYFSSDSKSSAPIRYSRYVLQGVLSVLGGILTSGVATAAAIDSTLSFIAGLDPEQIPGRVLSYRYAFLADPVLTGTNSLELLSSIERVFGSRPTARELERLRGLRALVV